MKLVDAMTLDNLRSESTPAVKKKNLSAQDMVREVFHIAKQEGRKIPDTKKGWLSNLTSKRFTLIEVFMNRVANPGPALNPTRVFSLMAQAVSDRFPVVIDVNKKQLGLVESLNYTPRVVIVDGREKFAAANLRGESRMLAWVGDEVLDSVHACGVSCGCSPQASKEAKAGCSIKSCGMKYMKGGKSHSLKETMKDYNVGIEGGGKRSRIAAVAPPGFEKQVKHMKKHKDIDNPYALAWHQYNSGFRPEKG